MNNNYMNQIINQFSDFTTAEMLKELGFNEDCLAAYIGCELHKTFSPKNYPYERVNDFHAPTWWQIKEWLWEKHKIYFVFESEYKYIIYKRVFICNDSDRIIREERSSEWFYSPITAEIEAIKQAVIYLHGQLKDKA